MDASASSRAPRAASALQPRARSLRAAQGSRCSRDEPTASGHSPTRSAPPPTRSAALYGGAIEILTAEDIASLIVYATTAPERVSLSEVLVRPLRQAH
jgi:NADP-dependent 3-hydroxy acid dehydrogenase YdfG